MCTASCRRAQLHESDDARDASVAALLRACALHGAPTAHAVATVLHGEGAWTDTLMDLVWAVDWELDARHELRQKRDGSDDVGAVEAAPVPLAASPATSVGSVLGLGPVPRRPDTGTLSNAGTASRIGQSP